MTIKSVVFNQRQDLQKVTNTKKGDEMDGMGMETKFLLIM